MASSVLCDFQWPEVAQALGFQSDKGIYLNGLCSLASIKSVYLTQHVNSGRKCITSSHLNRLSQWPPGIVLSTIPIPMLWWIQDTLEVFMVSRVVPKSVRSGSWPSQWLNPQIGGLKTKPAVGTAGTSVQDLGYQQPVLNMMIITILLTSQQSN